MSISKQNIIVVSLVVSVFSLGSLMVLNTRKTAVDNRVIAALPDNITPIPTTFIPGPLKVEAMDSPDGTATFTLESQKFENSVQYSFFYTKAAGGNKTLIFSEEATSSKLYSVPYNTWSPDNVYIFLNESDGNRDGYIVFSVTGEPFIDGAKYLDIDELFAEKVAGFTIAEITGWAAPDLLLVNTTEDEKGTKVSYWFNVKTQGFTRLSTYFH